MLCGGEGTDESRTTCLKLVDQEWITSHHLQTEKRYGHASWRMAGGDVILIGGSGEEQTTEIVKTDGTTEIGTLQLKYEYL